MLLGMVKVLSFSVRARTMASGWNAGIQLLKRQGHFALKETGQSKAPNHHTEGKMIKIVEAKSVKDYLDRYYKKSRMTDTLLESYEKE